MNQQDRSIRLMSSLSIALSTNYSNRPAARRPELTNGKAFSLITVSIAGQVNITNVSSGKSLTIVTGFSVPLAPPNESLPGPSRIVSPKTPGKRAD